MPQHTSHQIYFNVPALVYHRPIFNQIRPQGYLNSRPTEPKPQPIPEPVNIDPETEPEQLTI